jgi:hypothetical protein
MRKILYVGILCISFSASAQLRSGFIGGLTLNHNKANETNSAIYINKNESGYFLGATAQYGFCKNWFITTEILYSKKGINQKIFILTADESGNKVPTDTINRIEQLSFFEIPFFFGRNFGQAYAKVGASFSINSNINVVIRNRKLALSKMPSMGGFDFPIMMAIGYNFKFKKGYIPLEVRFAPSFVDFVRKWENKIEYTGGYNRTLYLGTGFNF